MIPKRIVLDTNVCLDLFVFRDPRWAALDQALRSGSVQAVTREDCRREWQLVLAYPQLKLSDIQRGACEAEFDSLIQCLAPPVGLAPLPRCSDGDDQKFLELARDADACALISKDKALLKLARKTRLAGMFKILPPERWESEMAAMIAPAQAQNT